MSHFSGGVHPATHKTLTNASPVKRAFIPKKVVLPLSQHVGAPAVPAVAVGDTVKLGQVIARQNGFISSPVHATIAGKVTKIGHSPTPVQGRVTAVTIEAQGGEDQAFKPAGHDPRTLSKEELLMIIRDAGIVGLGGAAFPTYVKLSPPPTKKIDTIIINGAECEPYLTCDHRLMVEKPKEILKGIEIITKVLGVRTVIIGIEDNKRAAIYNMERAVSGTKTPVPRLRSIKRKEGLDVNVETLHTRYPQGAEKQLIAALLDRVVPAGGLPMDIGCVVQNVGTVFAIFEAVYGGKPLIERTITLTGDCLKEPVNTCVRIGTLVSDLIEHFGPFGKDPHKVVVGGPMMGVAQYTMDVPIIKGTSGVLFLSKERSAMSPESVCIRCGKCIEACPMQLVPTALMNRVKKEQFAEAKELGIMNCYECGACAYSCPAKIPLLDYMKYGKSKIRP